MFLLHLPAYCSEALPHETCIAIGVILPSDLISLTNDSSRQAVSSTLIGPLGTVGRPVGRFYRVVVILVCPRVHSPLNLWFSHRRAEKQREQIGRSRHVASCQTRFVAIHRNART